MSLDALLHRREPTAFELLRSNPLLFLSQRVNSWSTCRHPVISEPPVRIVCIADTHNHHHHIGLLPDGDILIHAGDLSQSGTLEELHDTLDWLASHPHPHKLFIAGNHDHALSIDDTERAALLATYPTLTYLQESSTALSVRGRTLHVYGSPFTPAHGSWPFQYRRGAQHDARWDAIPPDTDILITHGPPAHHTDRGSGCNALLAALWRVRPLLHICGHIHAGRGIEVLRWDRAQTAYERICAKVGGWMDLLVVLWGAIGWNAASIRQTVLVNAACLGGFRDEQTRGAVVINL
ncbi:metallophosphoesterase domain-containing protein 1 [Epithele typhae]|uniref:metallophosphoesterase domain-containing protein 1 n=1 Tax=Epithele typhae TaxID=378194 RepID=UPI002008C9E2|nr:metallophosphoesterase domain-containing protein 1 [Epithele typhae]KAH9935955.1 metallophosphoesterase domain-containing protein 1 [Epithele typhae]